MPEEKYIIATKENPLHINIRNMLNPSGYFFIDKCSDAVSLIRLVRSCQPDFIVADASLNMGQMRVVLETIDDEMLCACIITGIRRSSEIEGVLENTNVVSFCQKPLNMEVFINTVEITNLNYRRVYALSRKLKEMTDNYESRKLVERAKAVLINRDGLTEQQAYEKIRTRSMDTRSSIKEVSQAILTMEQMRKRK